MQVGLAALFGLVSCSSRETPPELAVPVTIFTVAETSAKDDARYSANVEPRTQVDLDFQVGGVVVSIGELPGVDGHARDLQGGDPVRAGDVVARLQDDTYRAQRDQAADQLESARASFTKAQADFERTRRLREKEFVSESDFDASRETYQSARAQVLQSEAALEQAQTELSYCTLSSPIDGIVIQRQIETGDLAGVGTLAFQVADVSEMKVVFAVPAPLALRLELGEPLSVTTSTLPGVERVGRITRIAPAADQKTRTFDVEVTVANPDGRLKSGMVASLVVPEGSGGVAPVLVPLGSVVRPSGSDAGYAVYVLATAEDGSAASLRDVELGEIFGDRIAVLRGVDPGDSVVVRGASVVDDGQRVRVLP
jgi:multidrug efflux system membrane fusion protein